MDSGTYIKIKKAQEEASKEEYNNKQETGQEQSLSKNDPVQMYCDIYKLLDDLVKITEEQKRILNKLDAILDVEERSDTRLYHLESRIS